MPLLTKKININKFITLLYIDKIKNYVYYMVYLVVKSIFLREVIYARVWND